MTVNIPRLMFWYKLRLDYMMIIDETSQLSHVYHHLIPGDPGATGRMFRQCYEPIRSQSSCHLRFSPSPVLSENWSAHMVHPTQIPPQLLSAGTTASPTASPTSVTAPSRSPPTLRPFPRSLPGLVSAQFQSNKKAPSSGGHPNQPPPCRGRKCRHQRSDVTALTATHVMWCICIVRWLSSAMRIMDLMH